MMSYYGANITLRTTIDIADLHMVVVGYPFDPDIAGPWLNLVSLLLLLDVIEPDDTLVE